MKINQLKILGGNQQFADKIYNNQQSEDVDNKLIELIKSEIPDKNGRESLLKDLSEFKENPEKDGGSKKRLALFFDNLKSESGKQIARELIESGSDFIASIVS